MRGTQIETRGVGEDERRGRRKREREKHGLDTNACESLDAAESTDTLAA